MRIKILLIRVSELLYSMYKNVIIIIDTLHVQITVKFMVSVFLVDEKVLASRKKKSIRQHYYTKKINKSTCGNSFNKIRL